MRQGSGYQGAEISDQDSDDQGSAFRNQGSGFRILGSGTRVQGLRYRVQGSGIRVRNLGIRQGSGLQCSGLWGQLLACLQSKKGVSQWSVAWPDARARTFNTFSSVAWPRLMPACARHSCVARSTQQLHRGRAHVARLKQPTPTTGQQCTRGQADTAGATGQQCTRGHTATAGATGHTLAWAS